jgi:hypothetical protein
MAGGRRGTAAVPADCSNWVRAFDGIKSGRDARGPRAAADCDGRERETRPIFCRGAGGGRVLRKSIVAIVVIAAVVVAGAVVWRFVSAAGFYGLSGSGVPADKADYVGAWTAPGHVLTIAATGKVHYERHENNVNVTLDLPIQKFSGDDFEIGALFWLTKFHVTAPPHLDGNVWRMTSDGVEYSHPQQRSV